MMLGPISTSPWKSTEATHKRSTSAPKAGLAFWSLPPSMMSSGVQRVADALAHLQALPLTWTAHVAHALWPWLL